MLSVIIVQLAGGVLTDNYKFTDSNEKQRVGRFWGGQTPWETMYVTMHKAYNGISMLALLDKLQF